MGNRLDETKTREIDIHAGNWPEVRVEKASADELWQEWRRAALAEDAAQTRYAARCRYAERIRCAYELAVSRERDEAKDKSHE